MTTRYRINTPHSEWVLIDPTERELREELRAIMVPRKGDVPGWLRQDMVELIEDWLEWHEFERLDETESELLYLNIKIEQLEGEEQ